MAALVVPGAGTARAAPFHSGNIVVYRVGDGSTPLADSAAPVFLDEYTPAGVLVQSIPMPTGAAGAKRSVAVKFVGGSTAYAGFTGATGPGTSIQKVLNWTYTVMPPSAPAGLTATAGTDGTASVLLNWTAGPAGTTYNVYRGTTAGGEAATPIATGLTTPPYNDSSVTGGQTYYYKVTAVDAGGEGPASAEVSAAPLAPALPPTFTVNDGSAQRSKVQSLTLTFSSPVALQAGAVTLTQRAGPAGAAGGDVALSASNPSGDGVTWLVTFTGASGPALEGGSLADGVYDLTGHASLVSAASAGSAAPMTTDATYTFHRLFGDADGNKTVNALEFAKFKQSFGSNAGEPAYNAAFDSDGNGAINALDCAQFKKRFGTSVTY